MSRFHLNMYHFGQKKVKSGEKGGKSADPGFPRSFLVKLSIVVNKF